jgi:putative hydrolase of the HAD superfamily
MLNSKGIKNIILDFGGVVLNLDTDRTIRAFRELKYTNVDESTGKLKDSKLFTDYEIGIISDDEFRDDIISKCQIPVSFPVFDNAWNAMLLDYPKENIEIIQKLSKTYRVFLLSNTNKIHYDFYIIVFRRQFGFELRSLFEKSYFSHEIGMRKPKPDIFQKVLHENQLNAGECLFIDDLEENRKAASQFGIQTVNFNTNQGLNTIF